MSMDLINKTILAVLAFSSATSCTSRVREFVVDGVPGRFCVPEEYVPSDIWWAPSDAEGTPDGFSFLGCTTSKASVVGGCGLLGQLVSADVEPNNISRIESWGNLKNSALFMGLSNDPSTKYEVDGLTGFLVVSNPHAWKEWFIWRRADSQENDENGPNDKDTLVASCSEVADFPNSSGVGFEGKYGCRRYAPGPAFAVRYRFISQSRIPVQLDDLDAALFSQVGRWQCKA